MATQISRNLKLGAAIPICEQDTAYLGVLLPEIERMGMDVAWLANNCSTGTVERLRGFSRTVGVHEHHGSYNNCLRNYPMEILKAKGCDWLVQWDADELWEPEAPERLRAAIKDQKAITVRMGHIWGESVTTDWASERDRLYNLKYPWIYTDKVIAGARLLDQEWTPEVVDVWMIHYGYSTPELRKSHKIRWDLNHGHSVGKNPYGQWNTINQENYTPNLVEYSEFISGLHQS